MTANQVGKPVKILLVEDNPADVRLTKEALTEGKIRNELDVVDNGEMALGYLRRKGNYANASRGRT